jgi:hypothetical protein
MVLAPSELNTGREELPTGGLNLPVPLHLTLSEIFVLPVVQRAPKTQPLVKTLGLLPAG